MTLSMLLDESMLFTYPTKMSDKELQLKMDHNFDDHSKYTVCVPNYPNSPPFHVDSSLEQPDSFVMLSPFWGAL